MVQGFERIFGATIFFGTEEQRQALMCSCVRFHFFDRMQLWYKRDEEAGAAIGARSTNTITLSEAFYNEIDHHRIPVERKVVAALANAPGILDDLRLARVEELDLNRNP
jgi:hypothetical protein